MKLLENTTIYQCEYCNKISLSKGGMAVHEKHCKNNPANHLLCASCKFCEKEVKEEADEKPCEYCSDFYSDGFTELDGYREPPCCHAYFGEENCKKFKYTTTFTCLKDGKKMYSPKVDKLPKELRQAVLASCEKPMANEIVGCEYYKDNFDIDDELLNL